MNFALRLVVAGIKACLKQAVTVLATEMRMRRPDEPELTPAPPLHMALTLLRKGLETPAHVKTVYELVAEDLVIALRAEFSAEEMQQFCCLLAGTALRCFHVPMPDTPSGALYLEAEIHRFAKRRYEEGGELLLAAYAHCIIHLTSALAR